MNIRKIVDELGTIKAEIAPLLDRYDALKAKLVALGPDLYAGRDYDARVVQGDRTTVDMDKLRILLTEAQLGLVSRETRVISLTVYAKLAPRKAA